MGRLYLVQEYGGENLCWLYLGQDWVYGYWLAVSVSIGVCGYGLSVSRSGYGSECMG
jgi:hypothetical protein